MSLPMPSLGKDHDTACRAPGAPAACYPVPHPVFQEALYHDLVVNVPYSPLKDYYSVNLSLDTQREKLTRWGKTFWICPVTDEGARQALVARIRAPERRQTWWRDLLRKVTRNILRATRA